MSLIYEPTGKAREYSPLALNVYSGGCDHGCKYCYCPKINEKWGDTPIPRNLSGLKNEALRANRQITLCFMGDPYCQAEIKYRNTRSALMILKQAQCSVAILTKGGSRCLEDIEIFKDWPEDRIKVGATLTFISDKLSKQFEPRATLPDDRLKALKCLKAQGIKTWASIEPVIDPKESLAIIKKSLDCVDAYKVGKLNHQYNKTDWAKFVIDAVNIIRDVGRLLYVKDDLRIFAPLGFLRPEECNPENLFLLDRPILTNPNLFG